MERTKCTIREAVENDHGRLLLIAEETLQPLAAKAGHPEKYRAGDVVALLGRADVFVAEHEDKAVGFIAVEADGDTCAVRCICVHPAFEARGVADQLLEWVEGQAISRHRACLAAVVPEFDAPSLHLYRGHGFSSRPAGDDLLALEKPLPTAEN